MRRSYFFPVYQPAIDYPSKIIQNGESPKDKKRIVEGWTFFVDHVKKKIQKQQGGDFSG
jgi:hypothetical protein